MGWVGALGRRRGVGALGLSAGGGALGAVLEREGGIKGPEKRKRESRNFGFITYLHQIY